jgi:hypothetical protein
MYRILREKTNGKLRNTNRHFKDGASNDLAGFCVSGIEHLNISINLYVITLVGFCISGFELLNININVKFHSLFRKLEGKIAQAFVLAALNI